ncbi:preprotein translocase subunit YajC [Schaalia meyeri]|uniref:Preprotein translocase subunit YajC n=1 Tax=Schaalia meyeri TaxID=52773 RepID=A0AAP9Y9I2_9ACTO|nr:preprotein translocase subunit YajC [Schaalia meyeri]OFQ24357.1 preprotein translocase [Actinomyces sp. HMSC062G12]QQC44510.1 preprotein translocase subunit YajC [Schaalia meyeri]SDR64643.1 preprotein translocase subunit YajC [Schaalia meyeri]
MNNYILLLLLAAMIVFMWWSSRSRKKQIQKMEQEKRDQLAAVKSGEWVRTRVGFWGRFVDLDGDIVVLETTDGHEMYWEREMIAEIGGQPPLADATDSQAEETADAEETTEQDSNVLGLGEMNSGVSSAEDLDEQQK